MSTALFDGVNLRTGAYGLAADGQLSFGETDLASLICTGDYHPEEYDQVCAEAHYARPVTLPMRIRGPSPAALMTNAQAIMQRLATASRYQTKDFVFTPDGGSASTFKVIGGALELPYDYFSDQGVIYKDAVLHLQCLPFVYGAAQNLGSSGAPLATNQPTPLLVELDPSQLGDVPADVTLFVKNRAKLTTTVQTITINATGGSFVLNLGQTPICNAVLWNMTVSSLQSFFNAALGTGGATVTGSTGGPFTITFGAAYALNQQLLTIGTNSLTGGSHSVAIAATGTTGIPVRSLMVACVSGNTTWAPQVASSGWTQDTPTDPVVATIAGVLPDPATMVNISGLFNQDIAYPVAHWTAPTLPTDRRFQVWLRVRDKSNGTGGTGRGTLQFRLRHVCGRNQVVGAWRSIPIEASSNVFSAVKMGSWPFPLGQLSAAGAGPTTTYLEAMSIIDKTGSGLDFDYAYYQPEDGVVTFETEDTSLSLADPSDVMRLESDQLFIDGDHSPAGMVQVGSHIRSRDKTRYSILTSQGFMATLDPSYGWGDGENVDVWATLTPRYIGLVA